MAFLIPVLNQWVRLRFDLSFASQRSTPTLVEQSSRLDLLQQIVNVATLNPKEIFPSSTATKKLHLDEISTGVFLLITADDDSTSTVLAHSTNVLAMHSDI